MLKEFTCIICPNGCEIEADVEDGKILSLTGPACSKGEDYVKQELTNPQRNIATSVLVRSGELPLASVRLTNPIPKDRIFDAMEQIKEVSIEAPVTAGTVLIKEILGYDSDVIVTKNVAKKSVSESGR